MHGHWPTDQKLCTLLLQLINWPWSCRCWL